MKNQIECTWTDEYKSFTWEEKFVIDELPMNDLWDNFATRDRLALEKFHREKNVVKECTRHFMSFSPALPNTMQTILEPFKDKKFSYNFLKITGSYCIPMHYDSYGTFVKWHNISEEAASDIKRTIVMMAPWSSGQVMQFADSIVSHWDAGTTYTWAGKEWHGATNFGFEDLVVMQITWL